jgi:hypothetical protein
MEVMKTGFVTLTKLFIFHVPLFSSVWKKDYKNKLRNDGKSKKKKKIFAGRYPVLPATFVEEAVFSPSYVFGVFVKI